ncbi:uncharacterized protein [Saccopteryx leptura]|uniref:uncharacterized protein n=1 Tax=Saccopteryx leptura TaxID=249018 RepID=UPI00339C7947
MSIRWSHAPSTEPISQGLVCQILRPPYCVRTWTSPVRGPPVTSNPALPCQPTPSVRLLVPSLAEAIWARDGASPHDNKKTGLKSTNQPLPNRAESNASLSDLDSYREAGDQRCVCTNNQLGELRHREVSQSEKRRRPFKDCRLSRSLPEVVVEAGVFSRAPLAGNRGELLPGGKFVAGGWPFGTRMQGLPSQLKRDAGSPNCSLRSSNWRKPANLAQHLAKHSPQPTAWIS